MATFSSASHAVTAGAMKPGTKVIIATPPFPGSRSSTSSGMLRGWSLTARHEEWLKITGAVVVSSAACMVLAATWERSTSMPMRFISATTSFPNSVSPSWVGSSVAESAHEVL